jgi:ABC-type dipeptide/oligopeptide/nickel transport system permease component
MIRMLFRQVAMLLIVCVSIVFLAHLGMNNFDPGQINAGASSLLIQTWQDTLSYFNRLAYGDLGTYVDFSRTVLVSEVLWFAYLNSMGLMAIAMGAAALLGLFMGVTLVLTQRRLVRFSLLGLTIVGVSTPSFLAVVLLQQIGLHMNTSLGFRLVRMAGFDWRFETVFLPVLILAFRPLATVTRIVSASLGEILISDYIRTANAKGLSSLRVLFVHAFRNIAIPYLSSLGISFRFSISTLILVEYLFGWPGVGRNLFAAIEANQTNLVVGLVLLIGLTIQMVNLLSDVAFRLIDPRIQDGP